ncbi:MAG TPA: ABC transporter permease subunit [Amycolatopsis sp.]|jgi:ABC-type nitrate/sulfonate/bicarbonate transport system permease component|nr:ABC transporter permease subunit [Amycolatopsis sp.]
MPRKNRKSGVAPLRGLLPLALLLVLWQVVGDTSSTFFPPPAVWFTQTSELFAGGGLLTGLLATLQTFVLSLLAATVLGAVLGLLIGRVPLAERLLGPILEYFRFLPGVALVPLAVLLVGYTESMKLYVVVFGALWPVLLQVRASAKEADVILSDVASSLRLSRFAAFRKIHLPSIVPGLLLGVKIAAPLTLVLVLVVEFSTQVSGLGKLMETAQQNFQSGQVYGLVVVVGIVALAINLLVSAVEGFLLRYRPQH